MTPASGALTATSICERKRQNNQVTGNTKREKAADFGISGYLVGLDCCNFLI